MRCYTDGMVRICKTHFILIRMTEACKTLFSPISPPTWMRNKSTERLQSTDARRWGSYGKGLAVQYHCVEEPDHGIRTQHTPMVVPSIFQVAKKGSRGVLGSKWRWRFAGDY